jgi:hypothetical protein
MASLHYRAAGSSHVLLNRSRNGDRLLLEDRSIWRVDPGEKARASRWPQWTRVRVEEARGNAHLLLAEVLGQRECVLAVYAGALPHAVTVAPPEEGYAPSPIDFGEPEI